MHETTAKGILSAQNGMNLYRGCTHGCIYCDSRSRCYQMDHDFEDIEVKKNAPKLLEDALRRKRNKCMIITGSMCDPYIHLEEKLRYTRRCLEIILAYGFGMAIQTNLKQRYINRYGNSYEVMSDNNPGLMRIFLQECEKHHIVCSNERLFSYRHKLESRDEARQISLFDR